MFRDTQATTILVTSTDTAGEHRGTLTTFRVSAYETFSAAEDAARLCASGWQNHYFGATRTVGLEYHGGPNSRIHYGGM